MIWSHLATFSNLFSHTWSSSQPVGVGEGDGALLLLLLPERPPEAAVPLDVGRRLADDAAGAVHPAAVVGGPLQVRAGVARLLGLLLSWRIFTHLSAVLGNLIFLNKINGLYLSLQFKKLS